MPSSVSKVVRKQSPKPTAHVVKPQRRERPTLRALDSSSPFISDGATTEADLCKWADWFARFHMDPAELYVPIALRTVDCLVEIEQSTPSEQRRMRCIREVAKFNGVEGIEWMLITWVPGLPGVQFQATRSIEAAMSLLDGPPDLVRFGQRHPAPARTRADLS